MPITNKKKQIKSFEDELFNTAVGIGLSLIVFLVLMIFHNAISEYGLIQMISIIVIHIIALALYYKSYKSNQAKFAIIALTIMIVWNVIFIILLLNILFSTSNIDEKTKQVTISEVAGFGYLTFSFIKGIFTLLKTSKQKDK